MDKKYILEELSKFDYIDFDEKKHKYSYLKDKENLFPQKITFDISSTGWVAKFKRPFHGDFIAGRVAKKEGISKKEVLARWKSISDIACSKGTRFHLYMENTMNGISDESYGNETLKSYGDDFYKAYLTGYESIANELVLGDRLLDIAGMVDNISVDKIGRLYLFDHKTSKDIDKVGKYGKMSYPFEALDDCNFNRYSLQMSLYKYLIERNTTLKIHGLKISWFVETNDSYKVIEALDLSEKIRNYLER